MSITVLDGQIIGLDGDVRSFLGIPYAAPPIGPLRWRPPQPVTPWAGTLDCTEFGADCPQSAPEDNDSRAPRQSEDCLTLNVWTPTDSPQTGLPVLVWIYGGSFVFGSASARSTDGAALAKKGAVVVAINSRVGLFGFLAHPGLSAESTHGSSGNYGLLDVMAALHWVRANIAAFGGDPNRITAFGVSSGSATLSLLLTSSLARGAFDRVILQSPGAFRPLATLAEAERAGLSLGEDIARLREVSADEILSMTSILTPTVRSLTGPRVLRPIVDGWVLPRQERRSFRGGSFSAVPAIVGVSVEEGASLTHSWPVDSEADLMTMLEQNFGDSAEAARSLYDEAGGPREIIAACFGDTQFTWGSREVARAISQRQDKVFSYVYAHRPPDRADGPHHSDEVPYVFGAAPPNDPVGAQVGDMVRSAWVNFASSGDPNGISVPEWPRYDLATEQYLRLAADPVVGQHWRQPFLDFVSGLPTSESPPDV